MNSLKILFFGSTNDSLLILKRLHSLVIGHWSLVISGVVTQPPRPIGRNQVITPTPVEIWAKEKNIPVLSFATNPDKPWLYVNEQQVIDTLQPFKADLLVSASYGQKIPTSTITSAKYGGLNLHPSLLPRWRGADPVPWAILAGDYRTGVSIVTLSEQFDQGKIIAQKKMPITDKDTSDPLRTKLFTLGAALLVDNLQTYLSRSNHTTFKGGTFQGSYARRLTRDNGFIPWELIQKAMQGLDVSPQQRPKMLSFDIQHVSFSIARLYRALSPWPGIWTKVSIKQHVTSNMSEYKRLKILACHVSSDAKFFILDTVQLEGKKSVPFSQFLSAYHNQMSA